MANWQSIRIGSLGRVVTGKTPSSTKPELFGNEFPFITPSDLEYDRHRIPTERYLSLEGRDSQVRLLLPKRSVCFTCIGATIGKLCMTQLPSFTNQQINSIIVNEAEHDADFVFYLLRHRHKDIASTASGAATPIVNKTAFSNFKVDVPHLRIQRKIASILSAYDDLIENNNRRIAILEEMAQAIYREWFVHFRYPGHEHVPLVDSPLGKIPDGWTHPLPGFIDFKEGPGLRRWQYREEGVPFLNIRTLGNHDIDLAKCQYIDVGEVEDKYRHFLLEPHDHVVSSSGTIGRIVTVQSFHLPLMLNTSIIRMRPKARSIGVWQLKHFLQSDYYQDQIHAVATGVAQKNYGPSHLKRMKIVAPTPEVGQRYEKIVTPLEERICTMVRQNRNLRTTRDLLLPKLISGKLDVEDLDIDMDEPLGELVEATA